MFPPLAAPPALSPAVVWSSATIAAAAARVAGADAVRLDAYAHAAGAGEFYLRCGFRARGHTDYRGTP